MARLVGNYYEIAPVQEEVAGTARLRPGRCSHCRVGIARPEGGPTWPQLRCPLCGKDLMQSTFGSRETRKGYVVMSQREAKALARGEAIEVERPLTQGIAAQMDIHAIYDRIPTAPERELPILNSEIRRRLAS